MGELTERGEIVAAGGAALADANGDDTLSRPDASAESADAERNVEAEEGQDPGTNEEGAPASAPGPADIPPPPVVEKADDQDAATRENR